MVAKWVGLGVALLLLTGCVPVESKDECKARITAELLDTEGSTLGDYRDRVHRECNVSEGEDVF
jgi:hypothetical protein